MDLDTVVNGLAHELWAMAQGRAPIDDVVTPMMAELLSFAAAVRGAEREACAKVCDQIEAEFVAQWRYGQPSSKAKDCATAIRKRLNVPHEPQAPYPVTVGLDAAG